MAKAFTFMIAGASYEAEPVKVERKKVYGYTEIRATTPDDDLVPTIRHGWERRE